MAADIFAIARSGLDVEWQRVEVIATNLANLNTTRTADGTPYLARTLVSGPRFANALATMGQQLAGNPGGPTAALVPASPGGTQVLAVETSSAPPRRVHDPAHPHADASGFVSYPNVDHVREMTTMLAASRAYEANLAAFNSARSMFTRALELGSKR
jgi:flagellar basal-body rod protein FlgC